MEADDIKPDQPVKVRFSADNKSGIVYRNGVILHIYPALNQARVEIVMPDGTKSTRLVARESVFPDRRKA